jgi:hypothetical protein
MRNSYITETTGAKSATVLDITKNPAAGKKNTSIYKTQDFRTTQIMQQQARHSAIIVTPRPLHASVQG